MALAFDSKRKQKGVVHGSDVPEYHHVRHSLQPTSADPSVPSRRTEANYSHDGLRDQLELKWTKQFEPINSSTKDKLLLCKINNPL